VRAGVWLVALAACLVLPPSVSGLEAELDVQVRHTAAGVVTTPGAPAQEVGVDRVLTQGALTHRQTLVEGLTAEGTLWASLDTLPSESSQVLPDHKLAVSARVLEAWLGWEPLPGVLNLGAGKRVISPSSGFSHTPLNLVTRGGETTGAQAAAHWSDGWIGAQAGALGDNVSVSVFGAPSIAWDPAVDQSAFVQGRAGLSLGSTDLQAVYLYREQASRGGLGLDGAWGDALTFRVEAAADLGQPRLGADTLAGVTWTSADQTTVMAEVIWDARDADPVTEGFVRVAGTLEDKLTGEVWTKAVLDGSGWTGAGLTWVAPRWSLGASWLGAWGASGTLAGNSALRWRATVEAKSFW
jgi:hypothetical protein